MRPAMRQWVLVIAAATVGTASVLVPYVVMDGFESSYPAPLFPLLATAWEEIRLIPTVMLLLPACGILGYRNPQRWLLIGFATMLPFLAVAIIEMFMAPTS